MPRVYVTHKVPLRNYEALASGATCVSVWLDCSLPPCLPSVRSPAAGSYAVRRGETTSTSSSVAYNLPLSPHQHGYTCGVLPHHTIMTIPGYVFKVL